ncbi:MAG TPA: hypothetical protein VKK81_06200 [Candidatus Binatia bacterium]|nr:hypothetical protein [Candidatus Binatia bacterium]
MGVHKHKAANLQHFRDFNGGNPRTLHVLKGRTGYHCIEVISWKILRQFMDISNEVNVFAQLVVNSEVLFCMRHPGSAACSLLPFLATSAEFYYSRIGDFCQFGDELDNGSNLNLSRGRVLRAPK